MGAWSKASRVNPYFCSRMEAIIISTIMIILFSTFGLMLFFYSQNSAAGRFVT